MSDIIRGDEMRETRDLDPVSNQSELLDYEIVRDPDFEEDPWQVWTPDTNGAIIGSGKTRNDAIKSAIAGMCSIIPKLCEELND